MPDMRGRKISMSTTSGAASGMAFKASSPVLHVQMHFKSGKEFRRRNQLSRTFGWSSTRAIFKGDLAEKFGGCMAFGILVISSIGPMGHSQDACLSWIHFLSRVNPLKGADAKRRISARKIEDADGTGVC